MMSAGAGEKMELTSHAPCCYAALDSPLTKFGKSAAFISPQCPLHYGAPQTSGAPSHDRSPGPPFLLHQHSSAVPALFNAKRWEAMWAFGSKIKRVASSVSLLFRKAFGGKKKKKNVVLICLVFGCNYQPHSRSGPLPLSSHIVSLLCFAFLICFFVPLSVFWFRRIEEEQAWLSRLR